MYTLSGRKYSDLIFVCCTDEIQPFEESCFLKYVIWFMNVLQIKEKGMDLNLDCIIRYNLILALMSD